MNVQVLDNLIKDTEIQLIDGDLTQPEIDRIKKFIGDIKPNVEKQENYPVLSKLYELEALTLYKPNDNSMLANLCFSMAMNFIGTPYSYDGLVTETAKEWAKNYAGISMMSDRFTYGP